MTIALLWILSGIICEKYATWKYGVKRDFFCLFLSGVLGPIAILLHISLIRKM